MTVPIRVRRFRPWRLLGAAAPFVWFLLVVAGASHGAPARHGLASSGSDIRIRTMRTGTTRVVAHVLPGLPYHGSFPVLAPNGRSIAYLYGDPPHAVLRVADLRTRKARVIARNLDAGAPIWSPDSRSLALAELDSAPAQTPKELLLVAAGGGAAVPTGQEAWPLAWAADGELFTLHGSTVWSSSNGGPAQPLFAFPDGVPPFGFDPAP